MVIKLHSLWMIDLFVLDSFLVGIVGVVCHVAYSGESVRGRGKFIFNYSPQYLAGNGLGMQH